MTLRIRHLVASLLLLTNTEVLARQTMSFVPGETNRLVVASHRMGRVPMRTGSAPALRRAPTRVAKGPIDARAGPGAPGSGFKLEDGVLTYPAPARFQPKNLKPL